MHSILSGEGHMAWYTDLRAVFRALGGRQNEFDFLATDVEFLFLGPDDEPMLPRRPVQWLSGPSLTRVVSEQFIQFVWGVFSALPRGRPVEVERLPRLPYVLGNPMFWGDSPRVQHPEAVFEIVCWSGSATLLLSRDEDIARRFRRGFPHAVDLLEHNRSRSPS